MHGFARFVVSGFALSCMACTTPPAGGNELGNGETGMTATPETETGETGETGGPECSGAWEFGHAIEMPELPPGDPQAGYEALITQPYVSCGIPWDFFALAEGALGSSEPLPGREGKNAMVGHDWTVVTLEDQSELVVSNCLQCHAGYANGELMVGLGKADGDFTTPLSDFADPLPDLPETSLANAAFNKLKARASILGPYSTMRTIGANPAIMFAIVLLAHRDGPSLAWQDEPNFELHLDKVVPADPPPWWRTAKKASHFANGMSRGDHRGTMVLASSLCTDSIEEAQPVVDYFADVQAYLQSIEAPPYPFAIDEALAAEGQPLFECHCAGCHGTYADDPADETYPNLLIPADIIGTDPAFVTEASEGGVYNTLEDWFNDSFYGEFSEVRTADPEPGYTAPPLDGIWATAPFFHNGSVPSIELVLDSERRPTAWRRVDYDSTNFDEDALGWPWEPAEVHADAPEADHKYIYDTTQYGHGKGGHTFGDELSESEREALLEYLKTL